MLRTKLLLRSWLATTESSSIPTIKNYINGQFQTPPTITDTLPIHDPSTNAHISNIPLSSAHSAISAASSAYQSWSCTPVQIRQRFMMEYTHELHKVEIREEIAHWITLEMGKTSGDAMGDVWRGLEVVEAAGRVGSEMLVRNVMREWK